ncbi:MAG: alcohol dehydrogenase [Nitrospira sp.]|nr:alcohol dehydrogenase [Nitrospira sp.]
MAVKFAHALGAHVVGLHYHRRYCRNPGNARFLRDAQHYRRC